MSSVDSRARDFWTHYQPGFRFTNYPVGGREFFAAVERHRYALEPAIKELVHFERWTDCDVLEVGCGIATDGVSFARVGARYTGVDFSDSAVSLAEHRLEAEGLNARVVQCSIPPLPAESESQDLVYSNGVIHHIPKTQQAIDEIYRVLRPGGKAIVMVYHRASLNYHINIMVVRRLLTLSLLSPFVAGFIQRATGEDPAVIAGHRELLRSHGLRYVTDRQTFLSNNTDGPGNPLSKVTTGAEARAMFAAFRDVKTQARFLNLRLYPGGERLSRTVTAQRLERRFGWHLWIEATKGPAPNVPQG